MSGLLPIPHRSCAMDPMSLDEIAEILDGSLDQPVETPVRGVSIDSRTLRPGELFFAIEGKRDGHEFIPGALEKGAVGAVVSETHPPSGPFLRVDRPRHALGRLGAAHRNRLHATVVGITGSVGKTTTKELLAHLCAPSFETIAAERSFNNDLGVPLTLLRADRSTEVVVCELGSNAPGEIARLSGMARPSIGVLTAIAPAHLSGLNHLFGVRMEKGALVRALPEDGLLVYNADDEQVCKLAATWDGRKVGVGREAEADLRLGGHAVTGEGTEFEIEGRPTRTRLEGSHHLINIGLALAVGLELGIPREKAIARLESFDPLTGRGHRQSVRGVVLIDETYNSNPASARAALKTLSERPAGRRFAILGEMLELGSRGRELHEQVGRHAARSGLEGLIAVGPLGIHIANAAVDTGMDASRVHAVSSPDHVLRYLPPLRTGDTLLFKGSRSVRMEQALEAVAHHLEEVEPRSRVA